MPLQAVEKRSLPDKVFEQLTAEIVAGTYPPGATIGSERELSDVMQVNRHVVREAIKRMEQIGLVKVIQGGRTTVLDYRRTAGLDLLALLAEHPEPLDAFAPLLAAALEMRAGIGADLARLCAQRGEEAIGEQLLEISARLAEAESSQALLDLDRLFWQTILDGAQNLAYQLAFNSLMRAVHAHRELSLPLLERELAEGEHRRPIAETIAAGDAEAASEAARAALTTVPPLRAGRRASKQDRGR